jgi:hypothetical protein
MIDAFDKPIPFIAIFDLILLPASPSPLVAHLGTRKISSARLSCSPAFVEELLQEACDSAGTDDLKRWEAVWPPHPSAITPPPTYII